MNRYKNKHVIILGHGEGDGGTPYGYDGRSERYHLEMYGKDLKKHVIEYGLEKEVIIFDNINVYLRNDFKKNWQRWVLAKSITEIHLNATINHNGRGAEIIYATGLKVDDIDLRFKEMLTKEVGWRRWYVTDNFQNPRKAKQYNFKSYRLVELLFIDNKDDFKIWQQKQDVLAKKTLEVILNKKLTKPVVNPQLPITQFNTKYIIQAGAFNTYDKAVEHLEKIQKIEKGAFIRRVK